MVENLIVLQMLLLRAVPLPQMELEMRSWRKFLRLTKVQKESGDSVQVWSKLGLLVAGLSFEQFPASWQLEQTQSLLLRVVAPTDSRNARVPTPFGASAGS